MHRARARAVRDTPCRARPCGDASRRLRRSASCASCSSSSSNPTATPVPPRSTAEYRARPPMRRFFPRDLNSSARPGKRDRIDGTGHLAGIFSDARHKLAHRRHLVRLFHPYIRLLAFSGISTPRNEAIPAMAINIRNLNHAQLSDLIQRAKARQDRTRPRKGDAASREDQRDGQGRRICHRGRVRRCGCASRRAPQGQAEIPQPVDPSQTWTGRGKRPRWYSAALASGKKEKDLLDRLSRSQRRTRTPASRRRSFFSHAKCWPGRGEPL